MAKTVAQAIRRANSALPGWPAPDGQRDPRWQAVIAVGEFIETEPEAIWAFVERWGKHPNDDLRMAIATCLLEHLLASHFNLVFPRVERLARKNKRFAETFGWCWKFGQAKIPRNAMRVDSLQEQLRKPTRRFNRRTSPVAERGTR